jgi:FAD/FMN-containing dehydrogenase
MDAERRLYLPEFVARESVESTVGHLRADCLVARPATLSDCQELLAWCRDNFLSICPRGGGYSYGDSILNRDNVILDMRSMDRILDFDPETGLIRVEPGVQLIDVFRESLSHRLTLSAIPSEPTITIAGSICANVNGKDTWRAGNFGDQVMSLKLLLAGGELIECSRDNNSEIFNAVIGGMGLLGLIVEATLKLLPVPSPVLAISRVPVPNLDALLDHLARVEQDDDFAVVWVDTCARGQKLGRAVVHATRWIDHDVSQETLDAEIAASFARLRARLWQVKWIAPVRDSIVTMMMHVQRPAVRYFNRFYYYLSMLRERLNIAGNDESCLRYFFDWSFLIPSAHAACGRHGYTVQLIVPRSVARAGIEELLRLVQGSPCRPAKLILRIHRNDDYLISFAEDGYSLNFELHPKKRHIERMNKFLDELIEAVIRLDGKIYLAKDHVMNADHFRRMYANTDRFRELKRQVDPTEVFQSCMYRRLIRPVARSEPHDLPPTRPMSVEQA